MRHFMNKIIIQLIILSIMLLSVSGCGKDSASQADASNGSSDTNSINVYYVNNDETAILSHEYVLTADLNDTYSAIDELMAQMETIPAKLEYEAPITGDIILNSYTLKEGLLTLDFASQYTRLDSITEILDRAAMVRTLTQLPSVDYILFTVDGQPLYGADGKPVGNMSSDTFIYNAGNEINTYEKVQLTLYFADKTGKKLIPIYRTVVYNSNVSMERLVMEQIIAGPDTKAAGPTISPDTGIISITLRDGICYVDLDDKFMKQPYDVTAETAIYSIVNSLVELVDVNKVQISVNGKTTMNYMDKLSLANTFERNLEMISSDE